ncbi:hypothetical protein MP228_001070 [Amoeboaphelidium protococcarum]|nr:hypothetical protein MP228_001070 [Amoeboaphelidium protococcarum]
MPANLDIDGPFHIARGMAKAQKVQQENLKLQQQQGDQQLANLSMAQDQMLTEQRDSITSRLTQSLQTLADGIVPGAIAGLTIGLTYGALTKYPHPMRLGVQTAVNIGLISGQFMGFKYLLPSGIQRVVTRLDNLSRSNAGPVDENGNTIPRSSMLQWSSIFVEGGGPGLDMPEFLSDMTQRDWDICGSFLAGGVSGYLTNLVQGRQWARAKDVSAAYAHNMGVRGAVVWSLIFGVGHYLYFKLDDYRVQRAAEKNLRYLYEHQPDKISAILPIDQVPEKDQVLPLTFQDFRRNPKDFMQSFMTKFGQLPDFVWYLNPLIVSDEEYQKLQRLEKEEVALIEEIKSLQKSSQQNDKNNK